MQITSKSNLVPALILSDRHTSSDAFNFYIFDTDKKTFVYDMDDKQHGEFRGNYSDFDPSDYTILPISTSVEQLEAAKRILQDRPSLTNSSPAAILLHDVDTTSFHWMKVNNRGKFRYFVDNDYVDCPTTDATLIKFQGHTYNTEVFISPLAAVDAVNKILQVRINSMLSEAEAAELKEIEEINNAKDKINLILKAQEF